MTKKFFGKYRGTVINNVDPEFRGRLLLEVPDVLGMVPSSWSEPCLPVLGMQTGIYAVPQVGSGVWVEFEQGDPDKPIWTGCFTGSKLDVPLQAQLILPPIPGITLQTTLTNAVVVSDMPPLPPPLGGVPLPPGVVPGGIVLKSATGAFIVVNDSGIYISNGKGASIVLTDNTVMVNMTALVVI